ncbi:hypothetical protein Cni_G11311 [Canna indica]|uniref:1-phosphatidylinositol-3-phosphate 5-kinase n=1 Tax=Canna indica TaxID=4628 RepID=A0AAQ3K635_9LILI|nr:hypothetical protein Cni_G11311 [Canna indica]
MDHLKMAIAKIVAHHPNVLLVEKTVSRLAQEYLLAKGISLVLNIKRPFLERIARCTGAEIVPSIDQLSSPLLGHCDLLHVEKYCEDHGTALQRGKKVLKNLMFFEGCPRPLSCTVLLKGANVDELKKVKHVVQYGVFAAYHLAMETSFLADEGAFLPELPLETPISVGLPDKPSTLDRSITLVSGLAIPTATEPQDIIDSLKAVVSPLITLVESSNMVPENSGDFFKNEDVDSMLVPMSAEKNDSYIMRSHQSDYILEQLGGASLPFFSTHFSNSSPRSGSTKDKSKVCFGECNEAMSYSLVDQAVPYNSPFPIGCLDQAKNDSAVAEDAQTESIEKQSSYSNPENLFQGSDEMHDHIPLKEEFALSPSDHQSILVSLSTRCVWKGTVCERSQLFRIKYYGNFDKPLGRFLRDHLFDESYRCRSCDMPSEAHVHCYTHRHGSLTISVRKLPDIYLPGKIDGKIWMWHRCLMCRRCNGFPPATRRVVMSDAAWGLSFGKILELSFSNHAAASRVASCGHSLHKDCLRFYGFGRMVACFRYASINVHSVYLPPPKVDFNYEHQEWITKEANEVSEKAENLFREIHSALCHLKETVIQYGSTEVPESRHHTIEFEDLLQNEKADFEDALHKALNKEVMKGEPVVDILEVNKLRRQLIFHSYLWDQRLLFAKEKLCSVEKNKDLNLASKSQKDLHCSNAAPLDYKTDESLNQGVDVPSNIEGCLDHHDNTNSSQQVRDIELDSFQETQSKLSFYASISMSENSLLLESGLIRRRTLSDVEFPVVTDLSDTFDARWTGDGGTALTNETISVPTENLLTVPITEGPEERGGPDLAQSFASILLNKLGDSAEDFSSRFGMSFINIYRSINKSWGNNPRFNDLNEDTSIFLLFLKELECQCGARFLLPAGSNDTVVPIYDDEPTSIISFVLVSPEYYIQLSDERDRIRDGADSSPSLPLYDAGNSFSQSFDEAYSDPFRSFASTEDNILSLSGSRGSLVSDPVNCNKAMHARVSFTDESPFGKVRYSVTCYFAKHFDALRRACCPSELDFIRSLSRCKKWGAQGGKSNVFFAKSLDDRFIVKQVTKTELESFIKFAPEYFKYLSESIATGSPTCLAKILGIYQVTSKNLKGGKDSKMDVLVMENLLFRRNVTRLYDLKGSSRSRYNPDSSGNNKVLLDQNLIESMPTSPIFVGNKAKRLLERAVWNDTSFLAVSTRMSYMLIFNVP